MRAPRLGRVKTRLAAALGAAEALRAYKLLVQTVLRRIGSRPHVQLRYTPDQARHEVRPWLKPGWEARPQGRGDLGVRMGRAFTETLNDGARRVVLIGSDCPHVTGRDVAAAWAALDRHEVVLGPAADGGYWLIGLKNWHPILFQQIDWGTSRVLDQTLERAAATGLSVFQMHTLEDIDTADQWLRFRKIIREAPDSQKDCARLVSRKRPPPSRITLRPEGGQSSPWFLGTERDIS